MKSKLSPGEKCSTSDSKANLDMVKIGLISAGLLSAFLIAWLHSPWLQQQNLSVATNKFEKINLK